MVIIFAAALIPKLTLYAGESDDSLVHNEVIVVNTSDKANTPNNVYYIYLDNSQ